MHAKALSEFLKMLLLQKPSANNMEELIESSGIDPMGALTDQQRAERQAIYEQHIDSKIADVKNTGNGRAGGSITAALFLQRFTNGVPWAHLDIAPTAWANKSPSPTVPEGGVGFAVRTLDRMVADTYEA